VRVADRAAEAPQELDVRRVEADQERRRHEKHRDAEEQAEHTVVEHLLPGVHHERLCDGCFHVRSSLTRSMNDSSSVSLCGVIERMPIERARSLSIAWSTSAGTAKSVNERSFSITSREPTPVSNCSRSAGRSDNSKRTMPVSGV